MWLGRGGDQPGRRTRTIEVEQVTRYIDTIVIHDSPFVSIWVQLSLAVDVPLTIVPLHDSNHLEDIRLTNNDLEPAEPDHRRCDRNLMDERRNGVTVNRLSGR